MTAGWCKGLLRLYVVLALPWVVWFGYAAYQDHRVYAFRQSYMDAFERLVDRTKNWGLYYESEQIRDDFLRSRNRNLKLLPALPFGLPLVALIIWWVAAGFRPKMTFGKNNR